MVLQMSWNSNFWACMKSINYIWVISTISFFKHVTEWYCHPMSFLELISVKTSNLKWVSPFAYQALLHLLLIDLLWAVLKRTLPLAFIFCPSFAVSLEESSQTLLALDMYVLRFWVWLSAVYNYAEKSIPSKGDWGLELYSLEQLVVLMRYMTPLILKLFFQYLFTR